METATPSKDNDVNPLHIHVGDEDDVRLYWRKRQIRQKYCSLLCMLLFGFFIGFGTGAGIFIQKDWGSDDDDDDDTPDHRTRSSSPTSPNRRGHGLPVARYRDRRRREQRGHLCDRGRRRADGDGALRARRRRAVASARRSRASSWPRRRPRSRTSPRAAVL